jgi:hypothetical protein
MMVIDPTKAAEAWRLIHECKFTMAATAKALHVGTLDVGDLPIAHKKLLAAEATAWATKAGVAAAEPLASVAAAEAAQRERIFGTARRLIAEGVESEGIAERLDVPRRTITEMPEARERHAANKLQRAADRRVKRTAEKLKFGGPGPIWSTSDRKAAERAADTYAQNVRDGWSR